MSPLTKLHESIVGNYTFPFSQYLYNRRHILKYYNEFLKFDYMSQDELKAYQFKRLKHIIEFSNNYVSFYQKRFKDLGLEPGDIKTFEDYAQIPPVGRQDVIDHYRQMVDSRLKESVDLAEASDRPPGIPIPFAAFKKHKIVKNTSSGSTGAPTAFYEDGSKTAISWAHELRYKKWFGFDPGVREARMARVASEYLPSAKSLLYRRMIWNQLILPGTNLAEKDLAYSVEAIKKFQPKIVWGYTSSLVSLANYMKHQNISAEGFQPGLFISWAAPLYEHERAIIESVFTGAITNIYGTRETGHISSLCPEGKQHINQESVYVETAETDATVPELGMGELCVTVLYDCPMPFLRYRMGDLGSLSEKPCTCGRTTQTFEKLVGRTGEVFETADGHIIAPNFWWPLLYGRSSQWRNQQISSRL